MPDDKTYTVKDTVSGKTVTFKWSDPTPPTDADFEQVFQAAGVRSQPSAEPQLTPQFQLGSDVVSGVKQQFPQFQQAADKLRAGSTVAGAAQAGNAALNTVLSPLSAVDKTVRQNVPMGDLLMNLVGLIPKAAGAVGETAAKAGLGLYGGVVGHNLGTTPENAQQIRQQVPALAGTVGSIVGPMQTPKITGIAKDMVGATARTMPNLPVRLESSAIKQGFRGKAGLETFDRPAQTNLTENYPPTRAGYEKSARDIEALGKQAAQLAEGPSQQGMTIDLSKPVIDNWVKAQVDAVKNKANAPEIEAAVTDAANRVSKVADQYQGQVPIRAAIELKGSLEKMGQRYDEVTGVQTEAYKAAAHKILEDITAPDKVPQLRQIGLKQRDVIEANGVIGKRVASLDRADLISWRMARAAAAGAGIGMAGGGVAGGLLGAFIELGLDNPTAKHYVALTLQRAQQIGKNPSIPTRIPMGVPTPNNNNSQ